MSGMDKASRCKRVYLIVLDGLGVGGATDAAAFGDAGSDTLGNISRAVSLSLPALSSLGLANLYSEGLPGLPEALRPRAHYGRLSEISPGKDSISGHWEMMGILRSTAPPTFPHGFPAELLAEFSACIGRPVLGNKVASGTVIIEELGAEQVATGGVIVYTSADSVFQVAAHTDIVPLAELYEICTIARDMLSGALAVDRVIARPFVGDATSGFERTADRRDFALKPPAPTVLSELQQAGLDVIAVGKVLDLFDGEGFTRHGSAKGNNKLMHEISAIAAEPAWSGLLFANLGDFDTLFGHRNDAPGFARALEEFDAWLADFLEQRSEDDVVMLTGDHGNDPTTASTDHSREQVPFLIWTTQTEAQGGREFTAPSGFMHVGATVAACLAVSSNLTGVNLLAP